MDILTGAILSNFDVVGSLSGALEFQRGAKVDQEFQLGLSKIDYKVAREQLHREDIRDLVELTTGRMDMYHVVGTLLLSFCIEWYTSSQIFDNPAIDDWFAGLFYISNFSAVAYLIFSVWLAMHASIASHAIGVRLLTTYTRLHSLPSRREQLERLKVKAVGMPTVLQEMLDQGTSFLKQRGVLDTLDGGWKQAKTEVMPLFGCHDEPEEERRIDPYLGGQAVTRPEMRAQHYEAGHPLSYDECISYWSTLAIASHAVENIAQASSSAAARPSGANRVASPSAATQASEPSFTREPSEKDEDEDDEDVENRHFREFYSEQRKWMSYDAHSRLCMSLGMNQLLQALAYYIFGIILQKARACAIASFFAVKMLSLLLLRLDSRDTGKVCFSWSWSQQRSRDIRSELESRRHQVTPDQYADWWSRIRVMSTGTEGRPASAVLPLPGSVNLYEDMFPLRVTISSFNHSRMKHLAMFFCFSFLPPAWAAFLLEYAAMSEHSEGVHPFNWDRMLALVCYFQHGVWLFYLGTMISGNDWFTGSPGRADKEQGPQLRVAAYLNIIEPEQLKTAKEKRAERQIASLHKLEQLRAKLALALYRKREKHGGSKQGIPQSGNPNLKQLTRKLDKRITKLRDEFPSDEEVQGRVKFAQELLDYYAISTQTPQVFKHYEAFLRVTKTTGDNDLDAFRELCEAFTRPSEVTMPTPPAAPALKGSTPPERVMPTPGRSAPALQNEQTPGPIPSSDAPTERLSSDAEVELSSVKAEAGLHREAPSAPIALLPKRQVSASDSFSLAIPDEHTEGSFRMPAPFGPSATKSVSIAPGFSETLAERPEEADEDSTPNLLSEKELEWLRIAKEIIKGVGKGFRGRNLDKWFQAQLEEQDDEPAATAHTAPGASRPQGAEEALPFRSESSSMIADEASPDEALPGALVRHLTNGTAILWWLCALGIVCFDAYDYTKPHPLDTVNATILATMWPPGAGFLHISSLSCNGSAILAGTDYAMLSGKHRGTGELEFTHMEEWESDGEKTAFAGLFGRTSADSCDVLSRAASSWMLKSVGSDEQGIPVPVPQSWRQVVIETKPCNSPPCDEALVAGWDGVGIVIASLKQEKIVREGRTKVKKWSVHPLFRVQPGLGECTADKRACSDAKKVGKYDNVTALLFAKSGQRLTVLLQTGIMDIWDLHRSTLIKRLHLGTSYTAICQHGQKLLLARDGHGRGPIIEEIQLAMEGDSLEAQVQPQVAQGVVEATNEATHITQLFLPT